MATVGVKVLVDDSLGASNIFEPDCRLRIDAIHRLFEFETNIEASRGPD